MCTANNGTYRACDCVAGLTDDSNIETIVFTPTLVKVAIKKLKLCGASSLHRLPTHLFKSLSLMFTSFISIGEVPEEWK